MVFIEQKDNYYVISLETNENVDLSKVYNQLFFSIYPLKGLRIFKDKAFVNAQQLQVEKEQEEQEEQLLDNDYENLDEPDETIDDKIIDTLTKEQLPNSYSELPLQTNAQDGFENKNENEKMKEDSDDESGFYNSLSGYLTKYLPSMFSKQNVDDITDGMKIYVPYDTESPVYSLNELFNSSFSQILIINNNMTYDVLEHIIRDLYVQIDYFHHNGYYFSEFDLTKIVKVQERYVYFNSQNIILIENEQDYKQKMNESILNLVRSMLNLDKDSEVVEQIKNIQYTQVFYFIKRIEREGTCLWI